MPESSPAIAPCPTAADSDSTRPRRVFDLLFTVLSLACGLVVFRGGCTGKSLLAPLDVAPNFYSQYQWLDESATGIPQNHYTIDIVTHVLPRHYSIYHALHRGEFPWWDPYTDCGRPLAAEAHISATDPIRLLLYLVCPFVWAWNCTVLIESFLFGLGAYLLLRNRQFNGWIAVGCALAYQYAVAHAFFQTPLCVFASFSYYALLWWVWDRLQVVFSWPRFALATVLCASICMGGNQQMLAYLALFTICFVVGYGFSDRRGWRRLALTTLGPLALGGLIALPILTPQLELYFLCHRPIASGGVRPCLTGLANFSDIFPWLLGTFRTLDASRAFKMCGLGFAVYAGSVVFILAAVGAYSYWVGKKSVPLVRTALLLILAYEVICLTPLLQIFYLRVSNLAVMGMIVLAAFALEQFCAGEITSRGRALSRWLGWSGLGAFVLANVLAFAVFPHFRQRIEDLALARDQNNVLPSIPQFRKFQIANLEHEISFENPETLVAAAGILSVLAVVGYGKARPQPYVAAGLLALNLAPLLMFDGRFIVKQPAEDWLRLIQGGPEQLRIKDQLGRGRLREEAPTELAMLFPRALAHFQAIHTTSGYSSFPLPPVEEQLRELHLREVDAVYAAPGPGGSSGRLERTSDPAQTCRFQWLEPGDRRVQIESETLNSITIRVDAGPAGWLVRTDRYYPGWRLRPPADLESKILGRSLLAVKVPAQEMRLTFEYVPRLQNVTIPIACAALLVCTLLLIEPRVIQKVAKQAVESPRPPFAAQE